MSDLAIPDEAVLAKYADFIPTEEDSAHLGGAGGDHNFTFLKVVREMALFADQDDETMKKITGIVVLEKPQRACFMPDDMTSDSKVCIAPDSKTGTPNYDNFPKGEIQVSGDKKGAPDQKVPTHPDYGEAELSCSTCALAKWGSHPERNTPWCQQQSSVVIASADENNDPVVYIIKFSPGALKHIAKFKRPFTTKRMPLFSQLVELTLTKEKNSKGNEYSVPSFKLVGPTEVEDWEGYAEIADGADRFLSYRPTDAGPAEATVEVVGSTSVGVADTVAEAFPGATVSDVEIEL